MAGKKLARKWFSVRCDIHGVQNSMRGDAAKFVVVGYPKNKTQRKFGGCPLCGQVARSKARLALLK